MACHPRLWFTFTGLPVTVPRLNFRLFLAFSLRLVADVGLPHGVAPERAAPIATAPPCQRWLA